MQSVEGTGKTREEAIKNALSELGVEMYEVDKIEIVDEGSRGILGFGARPWRVRVISEHLPDKTPRASKAPEREKPRLERGRGERGERGERRPRGNRDERRQQGDREEGGRRRPRQDRQGGERREGSPDRQEQRAQPERAEKRPQPERVEKRPQPERAEKRPQPERVEKAPEPEPEDAYQQPEAAEAEEVSVEEVRAKAVETAAEEAAFAPIPDAQGAEAAALLQDIIAKMDITAKVTFARAEDGTARLNVESEDGAILIGRKGRNLNAMQYLINRIVSRGDTAENTERLVVDVEGYVGRRRTALEDIARNFARRAKETGRNMRLKPMSPQDRRIIHLTLQDDPDVRTFSLGESLYRSVVISPKNARSERSRGPRGRGGRRRGGHEQHRRDVDAGQFGD